MSDVFGTMRFLNLLDKAASLIDIGPANVSRAIIQPIVQVGYELGYGLREINNALREPFQYLPFRDIQRITREAYSLFDNRERAKDLGENQIPSKASFADADLQYDARYFVTFRVKITHKETGETEFTYRSMYTDDRVSPSEWWEEFQAQLELEQYEDSREYEFYGMDSYKHNHGYDW